MALVVEPVGRRGGVIRGKETGRRGVGVDVRTQRRIPQRAFVCFVFKETGGQVEAGDRVVVRSANRQYGLPLFRLISILVMERSVPGGGVDSMSAVAAEANWPYSALVSCAELESLARSVLAVPDGLGSAVAEAYHVVFPSCPTVNYRFSESSGMYQPSTHVPVANVIAELDTQYCVALVVPILRPSVPASIRRTGGVCSRIKVEIKRIDRLVYIAVFPDHNRRRNGTFGLAVLVRLDAPKPGRKSLDTFSRGETYLTPAQLVKLV